MRGTIFNFARKLSGFRAFLRIRHHPWLFLLTLALDGAFLGALFLTGKLLGGIVPADKDALLALFGTTTNILLALLLYPLIYYSILIFWYSLSKFWILKVLERMWGRDSLRFEQIGKFYLFNLGAIAAFIFSSLLIFGVLAFLFQREVLKYAAVILGIPLLAILYSFLSNGHSRFFYGAPSLFASSFAATFGKFRSYIGFILYDLILGALCYGLYFLVQLFFRFTVFRSQEAIARFGPSYMAFLSFLSFFLMYLIIGFNRIYFLERGSKAEEE
ncbi:hypothetical protein HYU14_03870 [Candidatus Woesearchaeota archaeon]|nr:hypothetical protein [Candidatus Woesearchaeota archaeon]